MEQKGEGEQKEKRPESIRQHFVLSVRDFSSSSSSSSFYSSRRSRSAFNSYKHMSYYTNRIGPKPLFKV